MAATINFPDFDFSGFYYGEILQDLVVWSRANVPEITEEDPHEIWIQTLRAFSLVGHLNNVNLDMAALESFMATCQLPASIRAHMKLIDYEVQAQRPAAVTMLAELTQVFSTFPVTLVPQYGLVATPVSGEGGGEVYENQEAVATTARTDQVGAVFEFNALTSTFTDYTIQARAAATPWSPNLINDGNMLYVEHPDVLFDTITFDGISVPMAGVLGVWEYYDGELEDRAPGAVSIVGAGLEFNVDDLLCPDGNVVDRSGAEVQCLLNDTGAAEIVASTWSGTANLATTSTFLGQTAPSVDVNDYTVGVEWHPFEDLVDGTDDPGSPTTNSLEQDGAVEYTLPKSVSENWIKATVNSVEGWFTRFRVIDASGITANPTLDTITIHEGKTFVAWDAAQGQTRQPLELKSGTGAPSLALELDRKPVIQDTTALEVWTGLAWEDWYEVDNFLSSTAVDRHFIVEIDEDGIATVTGGDGTSGRVFPAGVNNLRFTYRYGAENEGNAGASAITVNRSGMSYLKGITNPRAAVGWTAAQDADEDGIDALKVIGPASLRALSRAVSGDDCEYLAVNEFATAAGVNPWVRAHAIEEGFGPKTVKLVLVGAGGGTTPAATRAELDEYFNGDPILGTTGVLVANQQVTSVDYTEVLIDITATIDGGDQAVIEQNLRTYLDPEAKLDDGITYRWDFDEDVSLSMLIALIHETDGDIRSVILTSPAAPVPIANDALPKAGVLTLTVNP